eukprot:Sspe_Gene.46667::Locus_23393_Transcript_1_1_Confidence_1.000_Length_1369::g.46667::m.46667
MTEKVPVMVWIHGGGYTSGCSDMYQGEELVARADGKVVVVTINYRLNVFGFLGSDQLRAKDGSTGNFGFQDQRAAIPVGEGPHLRLWWRRLPHHHLRRVGGGGVGGLPPHLAAHTTGLLPEGHC